MCVYFGYQIDSIMSTRSISENEASRRLKSEFLIQFDGVTSNPDDLVIVIGMIPLHQTQSFTLFNHNLF